MNFRRRWMVQAIKPDGSADEKSLMAGSSAEAEEKGRALFSDDDLILVYPQHSKLHGAVSEMATREKNMKGRDS